MNVATIYTTQTARIRHDLMGTCCFITVSSLAFWKLLGINHTFTIDTGAMRLQFCPIGTDYILIPVERVFANPFQRTLTVVVLIHIDKTVALTHLRCT